MKGRRSSAGGAGLPSGRASEVIGSYFWLPGGGYAFRGLSRPKPLYVLGAGVGRVRHLRLPVSVARLTVLPVLSPGRS